MDKFWMLMLNSSTFSCGRYGYSLWPIRSFRTADVVVADMVCGRYGTDPNWVYAVPVDFLYLYPTRPDPWDADPYPTRPAGTGIPTSTTRSTDPYFQPCNLVSPCFPFSCFSGPMRKSHGRSTWACNYYYCYYYYNYNYYEYHHRGRRQQWISQSINQISLAPKLLKNESSNLFANPKTTTAAGTRRK